MPAGATWTTPAVLVPARATPAENAGAASSAARSVVVWGDGDNLYGATRLTDATSYTRPTLIGTGGNFTTLPAVEPVLEVTGTPDGSAVAAWIRNPGTTDSAVMVSTLPAGSDTWSTTQVAQGIRLAYVDVAAGGDGTLAVTWTADQVSSGNTDTVVQAAILPAGASSWASPVTVSDNAATGNVYPLNVNALVAVTDAGAVTVAWGAEDGTITTTRFGTDAAWRERASTWTPQTGLWSAPVWVSPAGQTDWAPALAASGQTVGAIWAAMDSAGNQTMDAAVLSGGEWQTPVSFGPFSSAPAIAPGPAKGDLTALWTAFTYDNGLGPPTTMEASTWSSGQWSAPTALGSGAEASPIIAANNNGDVTAAWASSASNGWVMQVADLSGSGWSSTTTDAAASAYNIFALSEDPSGYLTAVFAGGDYGSGTLEVAATTPPPLSNVRPGSISGTPDVGQTLTASPGTWSPAAQTVLYQWNRNGQAIPGATARTYRPTAADLSTQITVTVTAQRHGSGDGTKTYGPDRIGRGTIKLISRPYVTGRLHVGSRLTAHSGRWTPAPATVDYQWLLNGRAIQGATSSHLTVSRRFSGKRIRVRVTVALGGYHSAAARSAAYLISWQLFAVTFAR
jgi:hypothetical protein